MPEHKTTIARQLYGNEPIITVDNHLLSEYRKCPRMFQYSQIMGLQPAERKRSAIDFGLMMHKGIEEWHKGMEPQKIRDMIAALYENIYDSDDAVRTPYKLDQLLEVYFDYYSDDRMEPINGAVELRLEAPADWMEGVKYVTRIDLVGKSPRLGKVLAKDIKTTTVPHMFVDKPNSQFAGYYWMSKLHYEGIEGMMVDLIGVYKNKPERMKNGSAWKSGASPSDVLFRFISNYSEDEIHEWKTDIKQCVDDLRRSVAQNYFRKLTESCIQYNKPCPYQLICSMDVKDRAGAMSSGAYVFDEWDVTAEKVE